MFSNWVGHGETVTVGWLDKRPINFTISWMYLDGHLFGFYEACSQLVDHKMIEEWFDENFFKLYNKDWRDHHDNESGFSNLVRRYRERG